MGTAGAAKVTAEAGAEMAPETAKAVRTAAARAVTVAAKEIAAAKATMAASAVEETQGAGPVSEAAMAVVRPEEVPALAAITAMAEAKGTRVMAVRAAA